MLPKEEELTTMANDKFEILKPDGMLYKHSKDSEEDPRWDPKNKRVWKSEKDRMNEIEEAKVEPLLASSMPNALIISRSRREREEAGHPSDNLGIDSSVVIFVLRSYKPCLDTEKVLRLDM